MASESAQAAAWNAELATLIGVMSARHQDQDPIAVRQLATGILLLSALPVDALFLDGVRFLLEDVRRRGLEVPVDHPESEEPPRPTRAELGDAVACIRTGRRVGGRPSTWCGYGLATTGQVFENIDHAILCRKGRPGVPVSFTAIPCPYCMDAIRAELR